MRQASRGGVPFGSTEISTTANVAIVNTSHGTRKAIAFAATFATRYWVVETGRLRMKRMTLSFFSWATPFITRKMLRMISVQTSETAPT